MNPLLCTMTYIETPPVEVGFLTKLTYDVCMGVGPNHTVLHPTISLVDTKEAPNFIFDDYLESQWKCCIKYLQSTKLRKEK